MVNRNNKKYFSSTYHFYMNPIFTKKYIKLAMRKNSSHCVRELIKQYREKEEQNTVKKKICGFSISLEDKFFLSRHTEYGFPSASSFLQHIITVGNIDIIEEALTYENGGDYGYYGDVEYASGYDNDE